MFCMKKWLKWRLVSKQKSLQPIHRTSLHCCATPGLGNHRNLRPSYFGAFGTEDLKRWFRTTWDFGKWGSPGKENLRISYFEGSPKALWWWKLVFFVVNCCHCCGIWSRDLSQRAPPDVESLWLPCVLRKQVGNFEPAQGETGRTCLSVKNKLWTYRCPPNVN